MSRTRTGIPIALAFATLSGAALAADPPASPPASTATAAAPAATVAQPAASQAVAKSTSSSSSSDKGNAGVRQMFCLNMSMQCFSIHQAAADTNTGATPGSQRRLDLHAPDIRRIVPESNLREPIQDEYEMLQETEQVQVEGTRPEIYVPGGLVSLPWAVMHPTQAWRIFLPVNSAK